MSAASGSRPSAFFSSTCDFAAASRATARCSGEPTSAAVERSAKGASNSPSANFCVRIRRTASSTRSCVTSPSSTAPVMAVMNAPKLYGAIAMSRPAFTERAALSAYVPPGSLSMPSQSLMRNPSKPSSPLSRSVFRAPFSCIRTGSAPSIETAEYDGMIEPTPASIAGTYGSTCSRFSSARLSTRVMPWSIG